MTFFYQLDVGDQFEFGGDIYEKIDDESAVDVVTSTVKGFNAVDRVFHNGR